MHVLASEAVQEKMKEESVSEKETAPVVKVVTEVEEAVAEEVLKSSPEQKNMDKKVAFSAAEAKGREFLSKIFTEMKLDVEIDVKEKNGYLIFDLKGKNLGILIGRLYYACLDSFRPLSFAFVSGTMITLR